MLFLSRSQAQYSKCYGSWHFTGQKFASVNEPLKAKNREKSFFKMFLKENQEKKFSKVRLVFSFFLLARLLSHHLIFPLLDMRCLQNNNESVSEFENSQIKDVNEL
jgi:hypothetical protein